MSKSEGIFTAVLFALTVLLVWFGYGHGADNLSVLLTVGGGVLLSGLASGAGNNENGVMGCILLILIGTIFAMSGAGFLVGLGLLVAAILAACVTGLVMNA